MKRTNLTIASIVAFAIVNVFAVVLAGCGTTTIIRQTAVVTATTGKSATAQPTSAATTAAIPTATTPSAPPGIWCLVQQGQMPLTPNCEIYPSSPELTNPPQGETILAGTWIGPEIGSGGADTVTESMTNPWAVDVNCSTNDNSNSGETQIVMVAHTGSADYYSWGDESCGPPTGPSYGNEFFREATVSVTLTIEPLTSNLGSWLAQFIQL